MRRCAAHHAAAVVLLLAGCVGGMPRVPATPDAVLQRAQEYQGKGKNVQAGALYQAFLDRYAGNERADVAQYNLAETHFADGDYGLAAVEYQVLIRNYGYSEFIDDALFKVGVCDWEQAPRAERDQQKSLDALNRFNQYRQMYPEGDHIQDVDRYIRAINERLAKKTYGAARWYLRQKNGTAVIIYCDKIIEDYPDNRYWGRALLLKGEVLLRRGQNEDAIRAYTRILDSGLDENLKREAEEKIREARR